MWFKNVSIMNRFIRVHGETSFLRNLHIAVVMRKILKAVYILLIYVNLFKIFLVILETNLF